jgi:hypothetical protein
MVEKALGKRPIRTSNRRRQNDTYIVPRDILCENGR